MKRKANRIRKWFVRALLLAAAVAAVIVAMKPQPVPADFGTVTSGALRVTVDHEGKTRVRERYVVSAPLAGRIHRIRLEPGDPVVANKTVLVTLQPSDPDLLDSRTLAEYEAQVKAAEAVLEKSRSERGRLQVELRYAETQLKRARALDREGLAAARLLDEAENRTAAAREAITVADATIRAAAQEVEVAKARLVEAAPGTKSNGPGAELIELRPPVSGVVLRRLRESEAIVSQGEPLIEVADPADLEIIADYLSSDAVKIRPGMPVIIDRWGGDEPLNGRVRRIEPSGFMKVSALGVEEQRVNVIVEFDDPREAWKALGDEYRVELRIVIWERENLLLVPAPALFRNGDGWAVFTTTAEDLVELRNVEIGRQNGRVAEVHSGLREGERVIIYPSNSIEEGVPVEERESSTNG
ncbi:MAG: HlyD family efflux transporter periplasmic adaptor subunit [bacterium]|nr:HlyD family efflux transporter periplasmic adaptor subunit [bacterium]